MPTLLIAGSEDEPVMAMNRLAFPRLQSAVKSMVIVPGATHLFKEPGKLHEVVNAAGDWFVKYMAVAVRLKLAAAAARRKIEFAPGAM